MSMWSLGESRCCICGEALVDEGKVFAIPPFASRDDPQGRLSDTVVHSECFLQLPERDDVVDRIRCSYRDVGAKLPKYFESKLGEMLSGE